jgi:hypothetical protein
VTGVAEDLVGDTLFDQAPGVEHSDPLAHPRDHREVVADEEDACPELLAERGDQVEHLGLHRRVEARRRLVEDEERRVLRERHRDDDPLLHSSRELMRVAAHDTGRIRDLHLLEDSVRPFLRGGTCLPHQLEDLGHLVADPDGGIQGRSRVLVDHRERRGAQLSDLTPAHREHVLAVDPDRASHDAAVARERAHERERGGRLPAPGLAHEPVGLASFDRQADAAQDRPVGAADAVDDVEVLELDGEVGHRSKVCAIASAIRLIPTTRVAIARAGKSTGHHAPPLMKT